MAVSTPSSALSHHPDTTTTTTAPFLTPTFDPADYLNAALPSLLSTTRSNINSGASSNAKPAAVPLPELSTQLQTLLAQLNAQTSRVSRELTQLTDEILRSGGRLGYEVEVLRGEVGGLGGLFEGEGRGMGGEGGVFVGGGVGGAGGEEVAEVGEGEEGEGAASKSIETDSTQQKPEYLARLRTLSEVRSRLDEVIRTFGEAMAWPLAPSELSSGVAASIISVSAPEDPADVKAREAKGKEYTDRVRGELHELLAAGEVAEAEQRVRRMEVLSGVWRGTAEEKARGRVVEGWRRVVDEKVQLQQRGLRPGQVGRRGTPSPGRAAAVGDMRYGEGGYGFLQNLKKIGGEVYLE